MPQRPLRFTATATTNGSSLKLDGKATIGAILSAHNQSIPIHGSQWDVLLTPRGERPAHLNPIADFSNMTREQISDSVDFIQRFAQALFDAGIRIPPPRRGG